MSEVAVLQRENDKYKYDIALKEKEIQILKYDLQIKSIEVEKYRLEIEPVKDQNIYFKPRSVSAISEEGTRSGQLLSALRLDIKEILDLPDCRQVMLELAARGVLFPRITASGNRFYAVADSWRDVLFAESNGKEAKTFGTVRVRPGRQDDVLCRLIELPTGKMVDDSIRELSVVML